MSSRYEVVGTLERATANSMGSICEDAILVDNGDDELFIARPEADRDE